MGAAQSRAGGAGADGAAGTGAGTSGEERTFGLENYGNTCYANSVLQVRLGVWAW
jgi:uncharacterized UBP type Zn finger protein